MKIAIDARAYGWAGVGRYTRNLIKHLLLIDDGTEYVVMLGEKDVKRFKDDLTLAFSKIPHPNPLLQKERVTTQIVDATYYSWREQTKLVWQLNKIKADLWHFTHFNVPYLFNRPYVVTIHDVTRFIFPGQIDQSWFKQVAYEQVFKRAVERAKKVICVSETTQHDLADLPIKLAETDVIYEGVDELASRQVTSEARVRARMLVGGPEPYLLYVGVWMGHKNLGRMLKAVAKSRTRWPDIKLVMTGRPRPGYVDVPGLARRAGLGEEAVHYLGYVPEKDLAALYAEAACLLMPSLYEGFGLPALEAAALGTPVVASNVSSLPEVLGDRAVLVNPEYVEGIVKGIEIAMGQGKMGQGFRGMQTKYSWDTCAQQTKRVYQSVLV